MQCTIGVCARVCQSEERRKREREGKKTLNLREKDAKQIHSVFLLLFSFFFSFVFNFTFEVNPVVDTQLHIQLVLPLDVRRHTSN